MQFITHPFQVPVVSLNCVTFTTLCLLRDDMQFTTHFTKGFDIYCFKLLKGMECSAVYSTVHYKEPLKLFEIRVGHSPGFGFPAVAILPWLCRKRRKTIPANTIHWAIAGSMLVHRLRRCYIEPLLVQCWSTVYDVGPTLNQQWLNISFLLVYSRLLDILQKPSISIIKTDRPLGYEMVYLPLCKVTDTPFHIQSDDIGTIWGLKPRCYLLQNILQLM